MPVHNNPARNTLSAKIIRDSSTSTQASRDDQTYLDYCRFSTERGIKPLDEKEYQLYRQYLHVPKAQYW